MNGFYSLCQHVHCPGSLPARPSSRRAAALASVFCKKLRTQGINQAGVTAYVIKLSEISVLGWTEQAHASQETPAGWSHQSERRPARRKPSVKRAEYTSQCSGVRRRRPARRIRQRPDGTSYGEARAGRGELHQFSFPVSNADHGQRLGFSNSACAWRHWHIWQHPLRRLRSQKRQQRHALFGERRRAA